MTNNRPGSRLTLITLLCAMLVWSTACQKKEPATTNVNSAPASTAASPQSAPAATPATETKPATEVSETPPFSLATPTDAYKTAYYARKNKDIATLKRVFAKDVLDFLTEMGSIEKKTLDDSLKELTEKPQGPPDTRDEKINGNRATLQYLDEEGKWTTMDFSKQGNEWKIDLPKAQ